jgi:phage protein U
VLPVLAWSALAQWPRRTKLAQARQLGAFQLAMSQFKSPNCQGKAARIWQIWCAKKSKNWQTKMPRARGPLIGTNKMLMTLGSFIFQIDTAAFQELQRTTNWRFANSERFGAKPATQFVGAGQDKVTLPCLIYPGQIGKYSALQTLRQMAATGNQFTMLDGTGNVVGEFIIVSMNETQSYFTIGGLPKKVDFSIELERVDA